MKVKCELCGEKVNAEDFELSVEGGTILAFLIRCPNLCLVAELGFEELQINEDEKMILIKLKQEVKNEKRTKHTK